MGPGHRNVVLAPNEGMLIFDAVADEIACIEVLDRPDVGEKLVAVLRWQEPLSAPNPRHRLHPVKPLQSVWQFLRRKFEMDYSPRFGSHAR